MTGALLASVVRSGLVESVHHGHLVVLDPSGAPLVELGEPDLAFWPRSALKPVQAVALLRAGWRPAADELALACSSHSGTAEHLAVVRRVLAGAGLGEQDLRNTPDLPVDAASALALRLAGGGPTSLTQNCSGKHAGMLAACVAAGWPTAGYLDPEHPLQQLVRATVADLTGVPVAHVGVDGCGAPLLSTTVRGLAVAFGRIAAAPAVAPGGDLAAVATAMSARPDLVGGPGRDVTAFGSAVPGLVVKDGAEGVYAAGLPDGSAVALKIADGSARPRAAVLAGALAGLLGRRAEATDLAAAVLAVGRTPVLGHGRPVGEVVVAREVVVAPEVVPGAAHDGARPAR